MLFDADCLQKPQGAEKVSNHACPKVRMSTQEYED